MLLKADPSALYATIAQFIKQTVLLTKSLKFEIIEESRFLF